MNAEIAKFDYVRTLCRLPHTVELSLAEFRLLVAVWNYTDAAGRNAYPGVDRLSRELGYRGPRQVERLLEGLVTKGYLVLESKGGGSGRANVYAVSLPDASDSETPVLVTGEQGTQTPVLVTGEGEGVGSENPGHGDRRNPGHGDRKTPVTMTPPTDQYQTTRSDQCPPLPRTPQGVLAPDPAAAADALAPDRAQAEQLEYRPRAHANARAGRRRRARGRS